MNSGKNRKGSIVGGACCDRNRGKQKNHRGSPKQNTNKLPERGVIFKNAANKFVDDGEAERDLYPQKNPMSGPVLFRGDRPAVIQNEKRRFRSHVKRSVGKENRKLAKQPPPEHDDENKKLEGVGGGPQIMPQR